MAGHMVNIEKLNKENFDTWKLQMGAILTKNDHWAHVNGTKPAPEPVVGENNVVTNAAAIEAWETVDQKARADIILSMSPSELCHIKHCTTSNEVWRKLEEVYHSRGPARKATLLKQLLFAKMKEGENMMDHLNIFFGTVDKLVEMDILVAEDLLSILLLYSIPDSYENFRCAIEARDELPTPEALKIKLLEEFSARREKVVQSNQQTQDAFLTRTSGGRNQQFQRKHGSQKNAASTDHSSNNTDRQKKPYKCNFCKKIGHKASDCWKKNAEKQKENPKQSASKAEEEAFLAVTSKFEEMATIATALTTEEEPNNNWCVDSGATSHMCHNKEKFTELIPVTNQKVRLAVDGTTEIAGKGTVHLTVYNGKIQKKIRLENTLYVPGLKTNLLSISKTTANGYKVSFSDTQAIIRNPSGEPVVIAKKRGDLYFIEDVIESAAMAKLKVNEMEGWHKRYGHLNEKDLRKLVSKEMVQGIQLKQMEQMPTCETCIRGKFCALPFPQQSSSKSEEMLELVHSDLCGPMRTKSMGGAVYFATFIDNKSRWVDVYFLKSKDEVKEAFLKYKSLSENQTGCRIKTLRTDNGLEYCGVKFTEELERAGIRRERTVAHTPQQNGTAERMNRTLVEMARCLMLQSKLPSSFWAEAISTAAYIRNRCPTRGLENSTPFEARFGIKPDVSHLRTFGCKAFALDKTPNKGKFEPRAKECIFIGYSSESKAYRLWDPTSRKIIRCRDVKFLEDSTEVEIMNEPTEFIEFEIFTQTPKTTEYKEENDSGEIKENGSEDNTEQIKENGSEDNTEPIEENSSEDNTEPIEENNSEEFDKAIEPDIQPTPSKRGPGRPRKEKTGERGRPRKLYNLIEKSNSEASANYVTYQSHNAEINPSVDEALNSTYANEWREAMRSEFDALKRSDAWSLVKRPKNKNVIGCRWVLRTKYKADGSVERRKARLVAKGYSQQPGVDFQETFAPVARQSSIRILAAIAAQLDLTLYQLDVVMAYVNGDLDEEIYMEQPEGFIKTGEENMVCSLKKSLYGLKQSGRQWFKKLDKQLKDFGLKSLDTEKCIYIMKNEDTYLIVVIYVDDIIVGANRYDVYQKLKQSLTNKFKMKDLGTLHYCLGIEFSQSIIKKSVTMKQTKYLQSILITYGMQESKPTTTPLDANCKLSKDMGPTTEEEITEMEDIPYQSLIGSLMYLAISTRPDISYAISILSQFNTNPGKAHWGAAKRVLRYLKGTLNHGLTYTKTEDPLVGYVDADWGGNVDDRVSYTGFIFKLANAAITWEARKQKSIALSSTEAEYMALTEAAKETVYLRNLLEEICYMEPKSQPTIVYCDNQGAQKLMRNPMYHSRTKHIDIRHHYIREVFQNKKLDVKYMPTDQMIADVLTKSLFKPSHQKCIKEFGLKDVEDNPR